MRSEMLNNPITEENSWEKRENQVTETRVTTEEREEITNEIRKTRKIRFKHRS